MMVLNILLKSIEHGVDKMKIENQEQLDKAIKDKVGEVEIISKGSYEINCDYIIEVLGIKGVVINVRGNSVVVTYGNSVVRAYGDSRLWAFDNSVVWAYDSSVVLACGKAQLIDMREGK